MSESDSLKPAPTAALALTLSLCTAFVLSQFFRSAIAVIAPELSRQLSLSAGVLGVLSGAFFIASATMQIPVGVLLDRFGPRRVIPALLSVAFAGALVFASARGSGQLILGQLMIGVGCSGVFMGGFVAFSRWYPAERFATVTGFALATSNLGTLLSGTPLAAVVEAFGWRAAVYATAGIAAVLAVLVLVIVRDAPPGHPYHARRPETLAATMGGVGQVLRTRALHPLIAVAFFAYASMMTVRGLWGGPYLADIYGLDAVPRGNVLLAISFSVLLGIVAYGPIDRVLRRRRLLVLTGGGIAVSALATVALVPGLPLLAVAALFCIQGGFGAFYILLLAQVRGLFPDHMVGRAMTSINFATFAGVSTMQVATGQIIGLFPTEAGGAAPEIAYRAVFGLLAVCLASVLVNYGLRCRR